MGTHINVTTHIPGSVVELELWAHT